MRMRMKSTIQIDCFIKVVLGGVFVVRIARI